MVMKKEHYILNEKWRPTTMDGYICEESFKIKVNSWIEEQNIPHLFFYGAPGSGKSTLAKIIAKNLDCDYLYLNAADKRSMEDIKNEIIPFVSVMSFKSAPKIVILDEATHILQASQVLLLNMIETYSMGTRFILTGNYPERLIEPLRSRLEDYNIKPPNKKSIAIHLDAILKSENIEFDIKDVAQIISTYYPDIRRIINNIQKYTADGKLVLSATLTNNIEAENKIILELSKPTDKTFSNIRQIIMDGDINDFDSVYKKLYNESDTFAKGLAGMITIIIHDHIYQSTAVIDKEICFMSCIQKIIQILK
jgi:replication factor C small subunit